MSEENKIGEEKVVMQTTVKNPNKKPQVLKLNEAHATMDIAKNLVIVKTQPGMAMATAAALDGLQLDEIVGSLAGDDAIFVATKGDDNAMLLMNKIEVLMRKDTK